MSEIDAIRDIPKLYTALAEWLSCVVYLRILRGRKRCSGRDAAALMGTLLLLAGVQIVIGRVPVGLWIPGMLVAIAIMYGAVLACSGTDRITAGYWLVRIFVLAEMAASLEWQLYYYLSENMGLRSRLFEYGFMAAVFAAVFAVVYLIEGRQEHPIAGVTGKELLTAATIGVVCFCLSNLSYVYTNTPFSSPWGREAFNIRTLIDIGGYGFLLAYHLQRTEDHVKKELDAIQNILRNQYAQYRQSQESIDIINHKYHDLKHQINILRQETDPDKKDAYLGEMERGIRDYEAMYKTGNDVLDTILSGVGLKCSRRDITFTCVADGSLLKEIYVMDLCTIFGNALDNAVEHEVQIEDPEKRLIHVTVSRMAEFVLIRFENYLESEISLERGLPKTTKGDKAYHGYGLKSIQYSVEKYHGTMEIRAENHWFVMTILIPL